MACSSLQEFVKAKHSQKFSRVRRNHRQRRDRVGGHLFRNSPQCLIRTDGRGLARILAIRGDGQLASAICRQHQQLEHALGIDHHIIFRDMDFRLVATGGGCYLRRWTRMQPRTRPTRP